MSGEAFSTVDTYFGEQWEAPMLDGRRQWPTPVGEACYWCDVAH